jgi:Sec-independent protein translocase protein TatA
MGNFGWTEMFFIVAFALIVFGPRKLPEIAKTLGHAMAQLRRASEEFKRTWEAEVDRDGTKISQPLPPSAASTATSPQVDATSPEIANEPSSGIGSDMTNFDAQVEPGPVNMARGRFYDDVIPEPEAAQPPMIGTANSASSDSAFKTDDKHPVSIA